MATVKFGATVVGVRGTIGGITFSANKSGPYVRQWSKGSNPKTSLQADQRSLLAEIPSAWRALTAPQQTLWDDFAALPAQDLTNSLGETYSISGYGWFNKINIRLLVMGRAIRVPVPTQSRPTAPTITDLEFPFLDGETAFVQYASGEFDPDFDLVLQVAQYASVGRLAPPSTFAEFRVLQNPNDTMTSFAAQYVNRLGLGNNSLKGFLRLYRQTTDGLRSSPGSAQFIAADATPFTPGALDYDGVNDFALRGADLTGAAESKVFSFATWFKIDGGNGSFRAICGGTGSQYALRLDSGNKLLFQGEDNVGAIVVQVNSDTSYASGSGWHLLLLSIDTATQTVHFYVDDDLISSTTVTLDLDALIDFSVANHAFGARVGGSQPWDGCISSHWFSITEALDFSDLAVRRSFISPDGNPLYLGDAGQLPTGAPPIVYFPGGDASNNLGSGGNFTNQGASNACADAP